MSIINELQTCIQYACKTKNFGKTALNKMGLLRDGLLRNGLLRNGLLRDGLLRDGLLQDDPPLKRFQ